jgi:hypothetical protein
MLLPCAMPICAGYSNATKQDGDNLSCNESQLEGFSNYKYLP